ncbi:MAG: Cna B-type domain-containing protein [Caldilinea sp. CFX5]|nr:Cna B-type domain-containing protein [Caldilinea sp. CFX5]
MRKICTIGEIAVAFSSLSVSKTWNLMWSKLMTVPRSLTRLLPSWRRLHRGVTICVLASLLAGLLPPPLVRSIVPAPVADAVADLLPAPAVAQAASTITGVVYHDYNNNGVRNTTGVAPNFAIDAGVAGVTVTAYDAANNQVGQTTSGSDGAYSLAATGSGPYRIEFSTLPADYEPAFHGPSNVGSVQFVAGGSASGVNFGVVKACDYCQNGAKLASNIYTQFAQPNSTKKAVILFDYGAGCVDDDLNGYCDVSGQNPASPGATQLATAQTVGTTWGMAYQRETKSLFVAAYMKRHAGFKTNGATGVIYRINNATGSPTLVEHVNFDALGIDTGADPHPADNASLVAWETDANSWDWVGKMSFGDLDISEDGATLYTINLFDRKLYAFPARSTPAITAGDITAYTLPQPASCTNPTTNLRPFGLGVRNGLVYVGMVCSGEASQNTADMRGYVYRMDLANNTNTEVLNFALNYPRTCVTGSATGACYQAEWKPWKTTFALQRTGVFNGEYAYPQPMLSDIVFDNNGDMILGLRDRVADQSGFQVRNTAGGYDGSLSYSGNSGGDLLRACVNGGSYTLENNGQCGSRTTNGRYTGTNSALFSGPGNGEYYYEEKYPDHQEISMGSLALLPGSAEVAMAVFDPIHRSNAYFDGGVIWMRNATGDRSRNWISFSSNSGDLSGLANDIYQLGTFAKAGGMGDMELLCDPAPLEIGNRVWKDLNGDGIQDANEPGIEGVTVQLTQTGGGTTSTTTDANGYYYFPVDPETSYTVRVDMTQNKLEGYTDSPANAAGITTNAPITDVHDSDYTLSGSLATIAYTTGTAGQSNHSLDFGFIAPAIKLGIDKQNSPTGVVLPGSTINYTVVLTGSNSTVQTNPTLSDAIPAGTTFVGGSGTLRGYQPTTFTNVTSDNFSTSNYAGGSGWSDAAWTEIGESDGIAAGNIRVVTGAVNCPAPTASPCLAVAAAAIGRGIERGVNLAGAVSAVVKIAVDPGAGSVQVSMMDGATPTILGTINTNGTHTFTIPAALLKAGVKLRFSVISTGGSFYSVDNISFDVTRYQLQTQSGVTPTNFLSAPNNFVVSSQYPLTLTYQVQVDNAAAIPGGLAFINNTAQAASTQVVDPVYDTVTNTTGIVIVGNYVWHDADQDGRQDAGEAPMAGVTVELVNGSNTVVDTAITNAAGEYYFQSPELAANTNYTIRIPLNQTALTSYVPTMLNTPGDDTVDSDGNATSTPNYVVVGITSGAIGTYDFSYDFGFYQQDWGDLPDSSAGAGAGNYETLDANSGPVHNIRPGLYLGATVDGERDGQPGSAATDDGADEDGVTFGELAQGSSGLVRVTVVNTRTTTAILYGFIDFDNDGLFSASETVTATVEAGKQINLPLTFAVPWSAVTGVPVGARFRLSTDTNLGPNGAATDGEVEDYLVTISQPMDWGDLADFTAGQGITAGADGNYVEYDTQDANGGPSHVLIQGFYMGALVDAESDGAQAPRPTANGDDKNVPDTSDEDGVVFGPFRPGYTTPVTVTVVNGDGDLAYVNAFFDFNGNGDFSDPGEAFTQTVTGNGTLLFAVPVPVFAERNVQLGARFRLSKAGGLAATGAAPNGEVEDYLFNLTTTTDWGDLPDSGTGTGAQNYQTLMADNGPNHVLVGGLQLGANEDSEDGGQPDNVATGDDNGGLSDEDAVTFPVATDFVRGQSVNITVTAINTTGMAATLYGFIDFNNNGVLTDTGEMVTVNVPGNTGALTPFVLTFAVPLAVASDTPVGARFRLSTNSGLTATGPATNGEVEDYLVTIAGRGELQVRKTVDWNLATANPTLPFTVTILGPSYPNGITETLVAGEVISFSNVFAGVYTVTEGTLPTAPTGYLWAAESYTPTNGVINVMANSINTVTIANVLMPVPVTYGAIQVNKQVNGAPASAGWQFTLASSNCLLPGGLTNPATTADGAGGSVSWRNLPVAMSGSTCQYSVSETAQGGYTLNSGASDGLSGITITTNLTTTVNVVNDEVPPPPPLTGVLTVTKMVNWNGNPPVAGQSFTYTITGPSGFTATVDTIAAGGVNTYSVPPGVYTVTESSAGAGWTTIYTATPGTGGNNSAVVNLFNPITAAAVTPAAITGRVYNDYESDGVLDTSGTIIDTGVPSVTVKAYDRNGNLVGSVTTNSTGNYSLTPTASGPWRLELSNLPAGYEASRSGTNNGSTTRFISTSGASNIHFAVLKPCDYCQTSPQLVTTNYIYGNPLIGTPSTIGGLYRFSYDVPNWGTGPASDATVAQLGAAWGIAYHRTNRLLFISAFQRRFAGYGPLGTGGIYLYNRNTNTLVNWLDVNTLPGVNTGADPHVGLPATSVGNIASVRDTASYDAIGKVSLGDIDLSDDGSTLWAMNLNQRTLLEITACSAPGRPHFITARSISAASVPARTAARAPISPPISLSMIRQVRWAALPRSTVSP